MKKFGIHGVVVLLFALLRVQVQPAEASAQAPGVSVIPKPAKMEMGQGAYALDGAAVISVKPGSTELKAIGTYLSDLLAPATGMKLAVESSWRTKTTGIMLRLDSSLKELGDEGYTLVSTPQGVTIRAARPAGIFYGVQTLRQLLPVGIEGRQKVEGVAWTVPCVSIEDKPRFRWRGLLLDPARHFLPKEFLLKYIDLMALQKLNRLHLHLTDDQGWRLEIKKYPKLTEIGARLPNFSRKRGDGWFYSQDDMRQLLAYAAGRYVVIIPEIEMPGHCGALRQVYPEAQCDGKKRTALCVGNERATAIMKDVLAEVTKLFPSSCIHIGGDECNKAGWKECSKCQAVIKRENLKNEDELQSHFIGQIEKFLNANGKTMIGWDSILEGGLAPNAVVQGCSGIKGGVTAARAGHDVIMSPASRCYFDYYQGPKESEPKAIGGFVPLQTVYGYEPVPKELTPAEAGHIIGVQGNVWGEYVATTEHAEYMSFPRACALSEVGWSARGNRDFSDFSGRLAPLLRRLDLLGVNYRKVTEPQSAPGGEQAVAYPGAEPGQVTVRSATKAFVLENSAIRAEWVFRDGSLAPPRITDRQSGTSIECKGDLFSVVCKDGKILSSRELKLVDKPGVVELNTNKGAARLAERISGKSVAATFEDSLGNRFTWRAILCDGSHYVRQELCLEPREALAVNRVNLLSFSAASPRIEGQVQGSPVVVGNFFVAFEHPLARNSISDGARDGNKQVESSYECNQTLPAGSTCRFSVVTGVYPAGQLRRAFLCYLERERAHPYRQFLHYNSWYHLNISRPGNRMTEAEAVKAVNDIGSELVAKRGVPMKSFVLDDGWDSHQSVWRFHEGFPIGFAGTKAAAERYRAGIGLWMSPWGGYGGVKNLRLVSGRAEGFEINSAGFSMAGKNYGTHFRNTCLMMINDYNVNFLKFDGMGGGNSSGGAGGVLADDIAAILALTESLRKASPELFISATVGTWPSPFWTRYADSIWRQSGDTGFAGVGNGREKWITYRDGHTYRNIVCRGPLYPLNSLMNGGLVIGERGDPGKMDLNEQSVRNEARSMFALGSCLQELYISPHLLTPVMWDAIAEGARWAQANADVLADTHWVGGDPLKLDVYGAASWSPRKGVLILRNPDATPKDISLDIGAVFELPGNAPRRYSVKAAYRDQRVQALELQAGTPQAIKLEPFEVLVFDALASK